MREVPASGSGLNWGKLRKREFLVAGLGVGLAGCTRGLASAAAEPPLPVAPQRREVQRRTARTTTLFKAPCEHPNALATAPEGLWIGEQKLTGSVAAMYNLPEPSDPTEHAFLVDWTGEHVLKSVATESSNTSGMAYGDGYIWMVANAEPEGVFQTDMNSRTVSHRQIPLGPPNNGGGSHGAHWQDGKLWLVANRIRGIVRVDPQSWTPEFMIPITVPRWHGITWDNGTIWMVTGNDSRSFSEGRGGLVRYDASTGELLEIVDLVPGSSDPHGLTMHDGRLISCDAGIHPNWPNGNSPTAGDIFRIDID